MAGFKDLIVWQKSMNLVERVYLLCETLPKQEIYGLCSQMQRSSVSIPSNIAEGHRRNNRKEYRHFCGLALGSAAELETQIEITRRVHHKAVDEELKLIDEIQRMLSVLIKKLS